MTEGWENRIREDFVRYLKPYLAALGVVAVAAATCILAPAGAAESASGANLQCRARLDQLPNEPFSFQQYVGKMESDLACGAKSTLGRTEPLVIWRTELTARTIFWSAELDSP